MDAFERDKLTRLVVVYRTAVTGVVFLRTESPQYARKEEERRAAEVALAEGLARCGEAFIYGGKIYSTERIGRERELMVSPYREAAYYRKGPVPSRDATR